MGGLGFKKKYLRVMLSMLVGIIAIMSQTSAKIVNPGATVRGALEVNSAHFKVPKLSTTTHVIPNYKFTGHVYSHGRSNRVNRDIDDDDDNKATISNLIKKYGYRKDRNFDVSNAIESLIKENTAAFYVVISVLCIVGLGTAFMGATFFKVTLVIAGVIFGILVAVRSADAFVTLKELEKEGGSNKLIYVVVAGAGAGLLLGLICCCMLRLGVIVMGLIAGGVAASFALQELKSELSPSAEIGIICASAATVALFVLIHIKAALIVITSLFGALMIGLAFEIFQFKVKGSALDFTAQSLIVAATVALLGIIVQSYRIRSRKRRDRAY